MVPFSECLDLLCVADDGNRANTFSQQLRTQVLSVGE